MYFSIGTSLFCPTSVIVTANVSQEKIVDNSNDENDDNVKTGKHYNII